MLENEAKTKLWQDCLELTVWVGVYQPPRPNRVQLAGEGPVFFRGNLAVLHV